MQQVGQSFRCGFILPVFQAGQESVAKPRTQAESLLQPRQERVAHQSPAHQLLAPRAPRVSLRRPVRGRASGGPGHAPALHRRLGNGPENRLRRCRGTSELLSLLASPSCLTPGVSASQEAFKTAKLAYRHLKLRVRKNLSPSHLGPASLEDAAVDYIVRNLDLYDVQASVGVGLPSPAFQNEACVRLTNHSMWVFCFSPGCDQCHEREPSDLLPTRGGLCPRQCLGQGDMQGGLCHADSRPPPRRGLCQ